MNTTRKMPHSMTKDGRAGRGGEHLVPCLEMPRENVFIGVKTGKKHDKGYLAYIGVDVGTDDILKEIRRMDQTTEDDRKAMESFLQELQAFKIGNVVSITFSGSASCALRKEADHPVFAQPKGKVP